MELLPRIAVYVGWGKVLSPRIISVDVDDDRSRTEESGGKKVILGDFEAFRKTLIRLEYPTSLWNSR